MSTTINATSPVQDAIVNAGNNAATANASRAMPADENTPSMPTHLSYKDDRAYERERQRVKKAQDVAKMRARKGQTSWPERWYASGREVLTTSRRSAQHPTALDGDVYAGVLPESGSGGVKQDKPARNSSSVGGEVNLSDLISTTKRTAKPRKHADSEFELVPHVRSVIALDDIMTHDFTINEPWEHVSLDEFNDVKAAPVSYAKALAGSK